MAIPAPPAIPPSRPPKNKSQRASKVVKLGTITALSVLVIGFCAAQNSAEDVTADCVELTDTDGSGAYLVVDDDRCDDDSHRFGSSSHGAYAWYYGGRMIGNRVRGGTTIRPKDANITSRGGHEIQRGGFGWRGFGGS